MRKVTLVAALVSCVVAAPALAHKAGDVIFRAGAAVVAPNESSDDVLGAGEFSIDDNTQLGLNFTYMVTDNFGVELLAATPFQHDVSLAGVGKIAEVTHLPPTVMLQYYFDVGPLRPYVGAGLNATIFFDEEFNSTAKGVGLSNLDLDSSFGVAAQVGVDYQLNQNWLLNASVWYLDIGTDVNFDATDMGVTTSYSINTDIDPWVYMLSVGYKF